MDILSISGRPLSNIDAKPIAVSDLTYQLPNGSKLFNNLTYSFSGVCGLVGNNGVGKSILAALLAGKLQPTSGSISATDVYYLSQSVGNVAYSITNDATQNDINKEQATLLGRSVATLLGVEQRLSAIKRVDSGAATAGDLEILADNWDIEARVDSLLTEFALNSITLDRSLGGLSGGEIATLYLLRAFLSGASTLILDEPTNHMDATHKAVFINMLRNYRDIHEHNRHNRGDAYNGHKGDRGTVILISHDREVLENVDEIAELSSTGLRKYGGNYSFYKAMKSEESELLESKVKHERAKLKRERTLLMDKLDRSSKRAREGAKKAEKGGLPAIAIGGRRQSSERNTGRLSKKWSEKLEDAEGEYSELHSGLTHYRTYLTLPSVSVPISKEIFRLDSVQLPYGDKRVLNYLALGQERVAVVGDNGSGKTTLLKVLTGEILPIAGDAKIYVPYSIIGQVSAISELSALEFVRDRSLHKEHEVRTALANINLLRERVMLPFNLLSGGEKLRVQILAELLSKEVPQLLILDEPTNHLDLQSIESLEGMLNSYAGTLLVVSHDKYFLERLNIDTFITLKC